MSWNAPPRIVGIEISRTPPSKPKAGSVGEALRSKLFLNVSLAVEEGMAMLGESRSLSLTMVGSSTEALFGLVSLDVLEVVQRGAEPWALAATQPEGRAGAVMPSKFSEKIACRPSEKVKVKVPRSVLPSWSCRVAVSVSPQERPGSAVNVKGWATAGPL